MPGQRTGVSDRIFNAYQRSGRAPGIYENADAAPPALTGTSMHVCAFVGVASRGPARVPKLEEHWRYDRPFVEQTRPRRRSVAVSVESFDEYERAFGGFEGPGLLPYAVHSFFAQGGRRAYIVRIVHDYADRHLNAAAVAHGPLKPLDLIQGELNKLYLVSESDVGVGSFLKITLEDQSHEFRVVAQADSVRLDTEVEGFPKNTRAQRIILDAPLRGLPSAAHVVVGNYLLAARSEGRWGNSLRADLGFSVVPLHYLGADATKFILSEHEPIPVGTLLRLTLPGGSRVFRFVSGVRRLGRADDVRFVLHALLDQPLIEPPESAEIVEGDLLVGDGGSTVEHFSKLGLSKEHPRWLATVLCNESRLCYPHWSWAETDIVPSDPYALPVWPTLDTPKASRFFGGLDRYGDITPEDFFDPSWVLSDPEPGDGINALTHLSDLSLVVAPDLYSPEAIPPFEYVEEWKECDSFQPCKEKTDRRRQQYTPPELENLRLDPTIPADLERITVLQERLVDFANKLSSFVVLLDIPPKLSQRQCLRWRARFNSSYAAAYHPWLRASYNDQRNALININPSAVAAGIIAAQEIAFGVSQGPANVIASGVIDVVEDISPRRHDELHPLGINVYVKDRDGVRLSAARTLSRDPQYRQLTVRRLILMLRRVLRDQTQWMVFEPNEPALWAHVRQMLSNYLGQLYQAGAFVGATEEEAFFVRCDGETNPPQIRDAGKLVALVGVAPSEPVEFIEIKIVRSADGTVSAEA